MDGGKVKKIKLADINPVFHKSTETNYTILLGLWECLKANVWVSKQIMLNLKEKIDHSEFVFLPEISGKPSSGGETLP